MAFMSKTLISRARAHCTTSLTELRSHIYASEGFDREVVFDIANDLDVCIGNTHILRFPSVSSGEEDQLVFTRERWTPI